MSIDNYPVQSAASIAAQARDTRKKRGPKRRKSVDELYGALVKAGLVRIVRKKGQPPRIEFI